MGERLLADEGRLAKGSEVVQVHKAADVKHKNASVLSREGCARSTLLGWSPRHNKNKWENINEVAATHKALNHVDTLLSHKSDGIVDVQHAFGTCTLQLCVHGNVGTSPSDTSAAKENAARTHSTYLKKAN